MTLIADKNGKPLTITEILARQDAYKEKKQKEVESVIAKARQSYIKRAEVKELSTEEISTLIQAGEYKLVKKLQESAKRMLQSIPVAERRTPFQVQKILEHNAFDWVKTLNQGVPCKGYEETPEENVPEHDMIWAGYGQVNAANIFLAREAQKRLNDWINERTRTLAQRTPEGFYCIAIIPEINLRLNTSDSKHMYVYNKKLKRPMKIPSLAIHKSPAQSRIYVINQILDKAHKNEQINLLDYGAEIALTLSAAQRAKAIRTLLQSLDRTLEQSTIMVKNTHQKDVTEFPALVFSLARNSTAHTHWTEHTLREKDEADNVIEYELIENVPNEAKAIIARPLTHYEFTEAVLKGKTDAPSDELPEQGLIEKMMDEAGGASFRRNIEDLPPAMETYAKVCIFCEEKDLLEDCCDYDNPKCEMNDNIAECVINGMFTKEEATELWGKDYMIQAAMHMEEPSTNVTTDDIPF